MTFHKEGVPSLILAIIFASLCFGLTTFIPSDLVWLHYLLYALGVFVLVVILQFFRQPKRPVIKDENTLYAPADGKVVVIEKVTEGEYLKDERIQISIFMSPTNVHINWAPISGIIDYFKYHPGKYLVAWHPKSSLENERTTVVIKDSKDRKVLLRQIAGAMARRIVWYVKEQMPISQGDQFGFIKFGSRVDIYLPLNSEILVNINDKTKGNTTPIARLK